MMVDGESMNNEGQRQNSLFGAINSTVIVFRYLNRAVPSETICMKTKKFSGNMVSSTAVCNPR